MAATLSSRVRYELRRSIETVGEPAESIVTAVLLLTIGLRGSAGVSINQSPAAIFCACAHIDPGNDISAATAALRNRRTFFHSKSTASTAILLHPRLHLSTETTYKIDADHPC